MAIGASPSKSTVAASAPWREDDRVAALLSYDVLDTPTEPDFDDVARLAAEALDAPIAVVNLVAADRQWFKAEVGIGARELPLDVSLCAHAILQNEFMVVPDTRLDTRFACNPLVTADAGLRFYAGALLRTPQGLPIGTLCVLDREPRPEGITAHQRLTLEVLARQVMTQLELRRAIVGRDSQVAAMMADADRAWRLSQDLLAAAREDGTLTAVNAAWTAHLGWNETDLIGMTFAELTHPEDLENTLQAFAGIFDSPLIVPFEYRLRHLDGTYYWFAWTGAFENGQVYASGRAVTAERAQREALRITEEALRQSQKMEAVGQLTGGLAHDFNNLLAGMLGNLELLQLRVARGRLDDLDRFINAAQGAGRRAASLTQRLLAFSRRQTLDPKPTDVNRLIFGLEEMLQRTVGATAEIEIVGAAGLWPAEIDAGQLENAIINLSINGRDAMPEGGKLTIETANKWIDENISRDRDLPPGQYISVCVTDTGTGMSPATIERAFEPFFTTKPIGQGTGLGLSMIYGFAKQSGGQVRIYSEVGQGTTVCVYLPRHHGHAEVADESHAVALPQSTSAQTVLVVDDEPTIRHLIDEVLDELGYTVIGAADGAAGIKVLQSDARIELLITDVGLPNGMNGRQVADEARRLRPGLKVLFITGFAENAAVGNGHLEPGMELLTKPFSLEALTTKVADMLKKSAMG